MHLNPTKCELRGLYDPKRHPCPSVIVHDRTESDSEEFPIPLRPCNVPFRYLGYQIVLGATQATPWEVDASFYNEGQHAKHFGSWLDRFRERAVMLQDSVVSDRTFVRLVQADLLSMILFHSGMARPTDKFMASLDRLTYSLVCHKLHLLPCASHAAFYASADNSSASGIGIFAPSDTFRAAHIHTVLAVLQSADPLARATTVDTLALANFECGTNILDPSVCDQSVSRSGRPSWRRFPSYVRAVHDALSRSFVNNDVSLRIEQNPHTTPLHCHSVFDAVNSNISTSYSGTNRKNFIDRISLHGGKASLGDTLSWFSHTNPSPAALDAWINAPSAPTMSQCQMQLTQLTLPSQRSILVKAANTGKGNDPIHALASFLSSLHVSSGSTPFFVSSQGFCPPSSFSKDAFQASLPTTGALVAASDGSHNPKTGVAASAIIFEGSTFGPIATSFPGQQDSFRPC